jgi:hypothetical protein
VEFHVTLFAHRDDLRFVIARSTCDEICTSFPIVITEHSRLKDGVASLAYVPVISIDEAQCFSYRDARNKSGHDVDRLRLLDIKACCA